MQAPGKTLAAWAAQLTWQDLPQPLREKALDHVVDAIGVMYSGIDVEACAGARRAVEKWGSGSESTVLGTRAQLPAASAAFLNTLHGRIHTYDDTYEPGTLHAGTCAVATALALSEKHAADGRTFLAAGLVDHAKAEARRTLDALLPFVRRGVAIVGLEPSCLLGLRDEFLDYGFGADAQLLAANALLFEEFLVREKAAGRLALALCELPESEALLHGHCHQKAFAAVKPIVEVLGWIPGLRTRLIDSSCCGMAGAFGYEARHYAVSMAMGELSLLPAVRAAPAATLVIADGFSCRHQIRDGAGREALHTARVLARALA